MSLNILKDLFTNIKMFSINYDKIAVFFVTFKNVYKLRFKPNDPHFLILL